MSFRLPAMTSALTLFHAYTVALSARQAPAPSCGIKGYDLGVKADGYLSGQPEFASREGCAAVCRTYTACQMFAHSTTECLIYSSTNISTNVRPDPNSPYTFYDGSACVPPIQPPATTLSPIAPAVCNVTAYEKSNPRYFNSTYEPSSTLRGLPRARHCADQCTQLPSCKAFSHAYNTDCLFYNATFASSQNTNYNDASPYHFYDLGCPLTGTLYPSCQAISGCVEGRICTIATTDASGAAVQAKFQQFCNVQSPPYYRYLAIYLYSKPASSAAPQSSMPGWILDDCVASCGKYLKCNAVTVSQTLGSGMVQCEHATWTERAAVANAERDLFQALVRLNW